MDIDAGTVAFVPFVAGRAVVAVTTVVFAGKVAFAIEDAAVVILAFAADVAFRAEPVVAGVTTFPAAVVPTGGASVESKTNRPSTGYQHRLQALTLRLGMGEQQGGNGSNENR